MSGYIGNIPVPQATQTRQTFTATASQTSFATGGYQAGYLDVFLNGVKLVDGTDYTATNGSDVVLTTGAASGDILEVVAYTAFEVLNQNFTGGVTVDNDGATVLTVDRATSDGTIIDLQKDGSVVGSIGVQNSADMVVGSGTSGVSFSAAGNAIVPSDPSSVNTYRDAAINLGYSGGRFKDLYLSGGVYLGGTGSANKLDDYEEGTWTPTAVQGFSGFTVQDANYVKIGEQCTVFMWVSSTTGANSSAIKIGGLPFNSASGVYGHIGSCLAYGSSNTSKANTVYLGQSTSEFTLTDATTTGSIPVAGISGSSFGTGTSIQLTLTYYTG